MLSDLLSKIGFSKKESILYETVLQYGRLSYTDLSQKTGLNRTTTYSAARELLIKGILQEDFSSPVKNLIAAPPEALLVMTTQEEAKLKEKKELVGKAIENIRTIPTISGYIAPAISFIPEPRIAQYLKQRNDEWNRSLLATDKTWWGFNDSNFIARYGIEWITWYWKVAPKGIHVKVFSNDKSIEHELQKQMPNEREVRFWRGNHEFTGSFWIIGEYVVTTNVRQSPHYLVEMRDKTLAHNLRTMFSTLWSATETDKR